jgi:SHS2 domain-containing protein
MTSKVTEGYRFLDHVSDALVEAWGQDIQAAFAQAALAFFDTMIKLDSIEPKITEFVNSEGHDEKELLYDWLETLLLKFDIDGMVYSQFMIDPIGESAGELTLRARVRGERYLRDKHGSKVEIKGVTYHLMEINKLPDKVTVRFLLDL